MFLNGTKLDRAVPSLFLRYGLSFASIGAALLLSLLLESLLPRVFIFPFLAAVVVSARFGGRLAALLATVLSTLVIDYFLLAPPRAFGLERREAPLLVSFVACALLVGWLSSE